MTWKTRLVMRESAFTAAALTLAKYFYYYLASWAVHVELLLAGILIGGLIGVINRITETPRLRSRPVGQIVLFRTVLYLASLSIVSGVIILVYVALIASWEILTSLFQTISPRYLWSFIIYFVLVVGAINFAFEVERLVGPGNLWRLLVGSYRRPRDGERVFLFMDLKGSFDMKRRYISLWGYRCRGSDSYRGR